MGPVETRADQENALRASKELTNACQNDIKHVQQVTQLALTLFDQLKSLHQLGDTERFWLHCAGLLHDIGWVDGQKGHHKASLQIILTTPMLPFDPRERLIIGSIARYHRKATPKPSHDNFAALRAEDQAAVVKLSALLRLADGLDQSHAQSIKGITCEIGKKKVTLYYRAPKRARTEEESALEKGALFEQVYDRTLKIEWQARQ